jgi:DNA processing protein
MNAERRARAALSRLVEPRDLAVHQLLGSQGAVETVRRIHAGAGALARFASRVAALDVDRDLAIGERVGARVVIPGDPEWPDSLDELPIPPWCLWVRGAHRLDEATARSVAIVGARFCTPYGEHVAADLAASVASQGWTVVSGAAFGIDAAAHRGALAVDGPTIAVLACGVDRSYPAGHANLLARIAEAGCIVTELAPGSAPMKTRFLHRNRIIAALTAGTVVVEAGLRSGSLNTLGHAEGLIRPIAVVPGPVTSPSSAGCHEAVRAGRATLVTTAAEVLELIGPIGEGTLEVPRAPSLPEDGFDAEETRVHESLPHSGGIDLDGLLRATALAPMVVLAALTRLEEGGFAVKSDGRWRKARTRRRENDRDRREVGQRQGATDPRVAGLLP